jgi:hypothetical protein
MPARTRSALTKDKVPDRSPVHASGTSHGRGASDRHTPAPPWTWRARPCLPVPTGHMTFTRTRSGRHSSAATFVAPRTASFAAAHR